MMIVGAHCNREKGVSRAQSIVNACQKIRRLGGQTLQIFLNSHYKSKVNKLLLLEIEIIKKARDNNNIQITVHGKYMYNFCRPSSGRTMWQVEALCQELVDADQLGANVVIHQGKNVKELHQSRQDAKETYVNNLREVLNKTTELKNQILLENSCAAGSEIGASLVELSEIYHSFSETEKKRIGICLDTCHLFVSGEVDIRKRSSVQQLFTDFEQLFGGLEPLKLIHFNDSKTKFQSKSDRHAPLLQGYIGNSQLEGSEEGLRGLVEQATKWQIPLILETHSDDDYLSTEINWIISAATPIPGLTTPVPAPVLTTTSGTATAVTVPYQIPRRIIILKRRDNI